MSYTFDLIKEIMASENSLKLYHYIHQFSANINTQTSFIIKYTRF